MIFVTLSGDVYMCQTRIRVMTTMFAHSVTFALVEDASEGLWLTATMEMYAQMTFATH
jgi:hypothetical protein